MRDNKQYLIVGLFVVIAATILIGVWLWFSAHNRQVYNIYIAIFNESVDGVTTNSVVKYNGVEVGKVKKLEPDPLNPRNTLVYLNILQKVVLNAQAYAVMKGQGLTGLSYISLTVPADAKVGNNIVPNNSEPYPIIPTKPSLLSSLTDQAQGIADNVGEISGEVKQLLNEQNVKHLSNILANLDNLSSAIASRSDEINQSVATMAEILKNVKKNTENLNLTFNQIQNLTNILADTTSNANSLITEVQDNTLQNVNAVLLPNLNSTISHLNQSSYQLEQLLKLLNQNPSALVRGKTTPTLGPGE
jgi:phospholipid/cholesterol/gamma-HCH transport system substrate-binding protein